ncbi:hypothetical protein BJ166DRAFT_261064 [Pestalotiopsis sp. NC0098]|nr:hypothetical protein BJ166DRAFT_261064 [Pestalotiopsis sp. NC0098]
MFGGLWRWRWLAVAFVESFYHGRPGPSTSLSRVRLCVKPPAWHKPLFPLAIGWASAITPSDFTGCLYRSIWRQR